MKNKIIKLISQLLTTVHRRCDQMSDRMNQWSLRTRKIVLVLTMAILSIVLLSHLIFSIIRVNNLRKDAPTEIPEWEKLEEQVNMKSRLETINMPLDSQQLQTLEWLYETSRQMEEEENQ